LSGLPRVALDARTLQQQTLGGIGRALENIIPRLAGQVELTLLLDPRRPAITMEVPQVSLRMPLMSQGSPWLQFAAPRWLRGYDGVFHAPFNGLPYWQPVPMVVTIHDISFESHPEWFRPSRLVTFRAQARHAARTARRILTVSAQARTEIVDRYRVDPARVLVAPNAVDPVFRPWVDGEEGQCLAVARISGRPYVVALGGAARRGTQVALEAWRAARVERPDLTMALVGDGPGAPEPGLVRLPLLSARDLARLFSGAAAFCYPTIYESFGLPALEAAACGCPVICARVGGLPEVLGDAAEWVNTLDAEAFGAALRKVVTEPAHAATLRRLGLRRAAEAPGWDVAAAAHVAAYRAAGQ
jgi:glycosyltransferase involved in cell wall biosynthesis